VKKMKKLALAVFAVASGLSAPSFAQSWYADLGAGRGKVDVGAFSETQTSYAVRLGYRFNPNIAVDAGYYDYGKFFDETRVSSWGASVVATAPIDAFDIYGRIGYARTELKVGGEKSHKSTAIYGVGGRYMFTPQAGLYVEYLYQKPEDVKITAWMAGVQFRF
jgi:predicted porin